MRGSSPKVRYFAWTLLKNRLEICSHSDALIISEIHVRKYSLQKYRHANCGIEMYFCLYNTIVESISFLF